MTTTHITKVFAAKDAKFFPLTADTGAAPTYGAGIDVPGIKKVTITGDVNSAELRGDNTLLDVSSSLGNIKVAVEFAKMSLDLLAAWFSNTVADTAETAPGAGDGKAVWSLLGGSSIGYVGFAAKAAGADPVGGDVQFRLFKLMLTSFPEMGLEEEDYKTATVEFAAVPLLSTDQWIDVVVNDTAAPLAAPVAP